MFLHGNNSFAELSKNLARYRSENDVGRLSVDDNVKNVNIVATSLSVLHNYFPKKIIFESVCR